MASREALRTQLDALQVEMNALKVKNRRLKEDRPEQAEIVQSEQELVAVHEENGRLTQELRQLKGLYEQLLRGTQEAEAEAQPMSERCVALEHEVSELKTSLENEREAHARQRELVSNLQGELSAALEHVGTEEDRFRRYELKVRQQMQEAELEQLPAVAEEKRKWEAREARLVRQLEDAEERLVRSVPCRPDFTPVQSFEQTEAFRRKVANATARQTEAFEEGVDLHSGNETGAFSGVLRTGSEKGPY